MSDEAAEAGFLPGSMSCGELQEAAAWRVDELDRATNVAIARIVRLDYWRVTLSGDDTCSVVSTNVFFDFLLTGEHIGSEPIFSYDGR